LRFLIAVGVGVRLIPPHQPQKNAFVERYHRNYKQECLYVHFPRTFEEVRRVTEAYQTHYNEQRPHQGRACQNRPPRQVFPDLPVLSPRPVQVQVDRWLERYHQRVFARIVGRDGAVKIHHEDYSLGTAFAGRHVALRLDAPSATFSVIEPSVPKTFPIKNVVRGTMSLESFIALSLEQAQSEERLRLALKKQWRKGEWDATP
jgi:hypothetical protein